MNQNNGIRPDWPAIRAKYASEQISLRELARVCSISFSTLAKRCRREGWVAFEGEILEVTESAALISAERAGVALGISAAELDARTLATARMFLDRIDEELRREKLNPGALRDLVSTARTAIEMGRVVHRMDEPRPEKQPAVDVFVMAQIYESLMLTPDGQGGGNGIIDAHGLSGALSGGNAGIPLE